MTGQRLPPSEDSPEGNLPRLLAKLIARRFQKRRFFRCAKRIAAMPMHLPKHKTDPNPNRKLIEDLRMDVVEYRRQGMSIQEIAKLLCKDEEPAKQSARGTAAQHVVDHDPG